MSYDPRKWLGYSNILEENSKPTQNNQIQNNYSKNFNSPLYNSEPPINSSRNFYDKEEERHINKNGTKRRVDEYNPSAPSFSGSSRAEHNDLTTSLPQPDPRKLDHYITMLQKMITPVPYEYKKMLPYDVICQLAHSILDGTVFDIAKGLQDIQKITEKRLSAKRMKLVSEQRAKRQEMLKRHKNEIEKSQSRPHQILIYEKKHAEELKMFTEKTGKELAAMDQKLVLDLDQQVSDQQATFERAGLPLFFITNNADEIRIQMYILEFIMKLGGR